MDEKKVFDFLEKIYVELQETKSEVKELKSDVKKLGAKIDGEITTKLKALSDEQIIMKNDIQEIKDHQHQHDIKFEDLKIAVDSLAHKQSDQEKEIWELRKVK